MRNERHLIAIEKTIELWKQDSSLFHEITRQVVWPEVLTEMMDLFKHTLEKYDPQDEKFEMYLTLMFCSVFGGMQFYLPRVSQMARVIQDIQIYREFDGTNVDEVARKYKVSQRGVYSIVKRQSELAKQARRALVSSDL